MQFLSVCGAGPNKPQGLCEVFSVVTEAKNSMKVTRYPSLAKASTPKSSSSVGTANYFSPRANVYRKPPV